MPSAGMITGLLLLASPYLSNTILAVSENPDFTIDCTASGKFGCICPRTQRLITNSKTSKTVFNFFILEYADFKKYLIVHNNYCYRDKGERVSCRKFYKLNINSFFIPQNIFLKPLAVFVTLIYCNTTVISQSCSIIGNKQIAICKQENCFNVKLNIPHIKGTSDYKVSSVDYNPLPFITPTGNVDPTFYRIGEYTNSFNFGFPFCFYDSVFSSAVLSPYGLISFQNEIANCYNNFNAEDTIPTNFSSTCDGTSYLPKSAIFICYAFLNPNIENIFTTAVSPPDRKIEWRVEGTAPCRRLIVSYYHIGSFENPDCSFVTPATVQAVLYESTGLIDIYFENYSCPELFDSGKATCGIQDWTRLKGITPLAKMPQYGRHITRLTALPQAAVQAAI